MEENPNNMFTESDFGIQNSKYKMIMREDTNEVISVVTEDYQLLTNKALIETAMPVIKDRGGILKEVKVFGNARSRFAFDFPDHKTTIGKMLNGKPDVVTPRITLKNSYDSTLAASIIGGLLRLVCTNGMTVEDAIIRKKNKHIVWNPYLVDNIEQQIDDTMDHMDQLFNVDLKVLYDTELDPNDIAALVAMFPTKSMEKMVQYISDPKNSMKNYWDLLNAATYTTSHVLNRDAESTHLAELGIYPTVMKLAQAQA